MREGAPAAAAPTPEAAALRRRVLSALVLIPIALAAIWAGGIVFALTIAVMGMLMAFEWARQVAPRRLRLVLAIYVVALALAIATCVAGLSGYAVGLVAAAALIVEALVQLTRAGRHPGLAAFGLVYLGGAALAAVDLRLAMETGLMIVLWLFALTWATDTFAYLVGRPFGRIRLLPAVSPGKTLEGLLAGVAGATLVGLLFSPVLGLGSPGKVMAASATLALVAQGGDFLESAFKRRFGVKDMSGLVPGHGGVMDRLDGLLAVLMAAGIAHAFGMTR